MNKNLHTNKELLDDFTSLTNRHSRQTLFLFDLLDQDFDKLVELEEKIHRNFMALVCPDDLEECEKVLSMGFKYDGLKNFDVFKNL